MAELSTGKCPDCGQSFTILDGVPQHPNCSYNQTLMQMPTLQPAPDEASKPTSLRRQEFPPPTTPRPASARPASSRPPGTTPHTPAGTPLPGGNTPRPSIRGVKPGDHNIPADVQLAMQSLDSMLANYVLVRQVGKGGMGTVWRAWDRKLARYVAIKFLNAQTEGDVARFQREAQLAAGLRHPNIAPIYEYGEHNGQWFLAMEFVDGSSLEKSKMTIEEIVDLMAPISLAVDYAHQQGVIHRDIKPQNVMLTSSKWPYIMDFGLAKQVEGGTELSAIGSVMGTPSYMPPEQAQGDTEHIDRRSDVYSLGATLYQLCAGQPPFSGKTPMEIMMKVLKEDPVPLRKLNPAVPPELEIITMKTLEKDPARRYQTAAELAEDLRRFKTGDSISARPPSMRYLVQRAVKRNPWLFISGGLAAVAIAAVTILLVRQPKPGPVGPNPIVINNPGDKGDEVARRQWLSDFRQARAPLTLDEFRAGDAENEKKAAALQATLRRADEFIRVADMKDVVQWFRDQAGLGRNTVDAWLAADKKSWVGKRAEAQRLIEWSAAARKALDGLGGDYATVSQAYGAVSESATRVIAYRGTATLRIHVLPWAKVESLKSGERYVIKAGKLEDATRGTPSDEDLTSPVAINDLEIDDYELELSHPELGKKTVKLSREAMENGREYNVVGDMGKTVRVAGK